MSDFEITVIDGVNVIESTTPVVEIISVGIQGPAGKDGENSNVLSVAGKTGHVDLEAQDIKDSTDYTSTIDSIWEI